MRVAIMTGGGDAPGLNGIIEAAVRVLCNHGCEVIGILDGFEGFFQNRTRSLTIKDVHMAHASAGTLLGSSNKSRVEGREAEFMKAYSALRLDGLIACGGDGTFAGLSHVSASIQAIGLPKTIDNDLAGTDVTFGYDTACASVAESVDALRFTAEAHSRVIVVETMGRTAGWIALGGGVASVADAILIPERPYAPKELLDFVRERKARGQRGLMIVMAEGATPQGGTPSVAFEVADSPQKERYGGAGLALARWIEAEVGWESRAVVLGHLQRARAPTTSDRFLTLTMGIEAATMALEEAWGQAVVFRQGQVTRAPLTDLMQAPRLVPTDHRWVSFAKALGSFI